MCVSPAYHCRFRANQSYTHTHNVVLILFHGFHTALPGHLQNLEKQSVEKVGDPRGSKGPGVGTLASLVVRKARLGLCGTALDACSSAVAPHVAACQSTAEQDCSAARLCSTKARVGTKQGCARGIHSTYGWS